MPDNKPGIVEIFPAAQAAPDPMARWYDSAWVRKARLDHAIPETVTEPVLFSPRLVPFLKHPRIAERGPAFTRELIAHRFFAYADFTAVLEREAVNVVTLMIARRRFWTPLPNAMYLGAGRIYTDEAFHAQESDEILDALVVQTGIEPRHLQRPRFMANLEELLSKLDPLKQSIVLIGFAIVSETLISSILEDIPTDPFVVPCIRNFVREHAQDEGRHHAYFSLLLKHGWPGLSTADQEFLGPLLPSFIRWFLSPDLGWLRSFLEESGFGRDTIDGIIHDSCPPDEVNATIRNAARHSVSRFAQTGMLESHRTADAFEAAGLTDCGRKHPASDSSSIAELLRSAV